MCCAFFPLFLKEWTNKRQLDHQVGLERIESQENFGLGPSGMISLEGIESEENVGLVPSGLISLEPLSFKRVKNLTNQYPAKCWQSCLQWWHLPGLSKMARSPRSLGDNNFDAGHTLQLKVS